MGEGPPAEDLGATYANFFDSWTAFYQDIGNRLTRNFVDQQKAYQELFGKWNDIAGTVGKVAGDLSEDDSFREAFDVWRNYSNKIGSRMARVTTEGVKKYGEVAESFERYGNRILDLNRQIMAGKFETATAEEVYTAWLDVAGKLREQMESAATLTREELQELSRAWLEFSNRMESLASKWVGKEGPYEELVDAWAEQSKDLSRTLVDFSRGHDHGYEEIRKAWTDHFLKMQDNMVALARAIGMSYENLYQRFVEGGSTALSDLSLFPRWWSRTQHETVEDLQARIGELERKAERKAEQKGD